MTETAPDIVREAVRLVRHLDDFVRELLTAPPKLGPHSAEDLLVVLDNIDIVAQKAAELPQELPELRPVLVGLDLLQPIMARRRAKAKPLAAKHNPEVCPYCQPKRSGGPSLARFEWWKRVVAERLRRQP